MSKAYVEYMVSRLMLAYHEWASSIGIIISSKVILKGDPQGGATREHLGRRGKIKNHVEVHGEILDHDKMVASHVDLEDSNTNQDPLEGEDKQAKIHREEFKVIVARRKSWSGHIIMKFYAINANSWLVQVSSQNSYVSMYISTSFVECNSCIFKMKKCKMRGRPRILHGM